MLCSGRFYLFKGKILSLKSISSCEKVVQKRPQAFLNHSKNHLSSEYGQSTAETILNPILPCYSTVTLLARLRGLSTSQPRSTAI